MAAPVALPFCLMLGMLMLALTVASYAQQASSGAPSAVREAASGAPSETREAASEGPAETGEAASGVPAGSGGETASDAGVPLEVYAGLSKRSIALGDTFRLNLDLKWRDGVEVKPLAVGDNLGPFTVRDLRYGVASPVEGGFSRRVSLLLTVFETGEQSVPSIPVVYVDRDHTAGTVETPSRTVEVVSVLPDDAAEPKDIKAPISVPKRWKDLILSYALLVGLAAGAATSVLFSVLKREQLETFFVRLWIRVAGPVRRFFLMILASLGLIRRRHEEIFDVEVTEPDLDPEEAALRELDRIEALGLLERQMVKQHYTLVSETVRRYLERKYGVLAMESPTSFTLALLEGLTVAPDGLSLTGEVLEEGDMVKFARFAPSQESAASLTSRARDIVALTGTAPSPAPVEGE